LEAAKEMATSLEKALASQHDSFESKIPFEYKYSDIFDKNYLKILNNSANTSFVKHICN